MLKSLLFFLSVVSLIGCNNSSNKTAETYRPQPTFSVRSGAVCNDGTLSQATGRGACSHHGGVNHWLYY